MCTAVLIIWTESSGGGGETSACFVGIGDTGDVATAVLSSCSANPAGEADVVWGCDNWDATLLTSGHANPCS